MRNFLKPVAEKSGVEHNADIGVMWEKERAQEHRSEEERGADERENHALQFASV